MISKPNPKPSMLLIDDNQEVLDGLRDELSKIIAPSEVDILFWMPSSNDENPDEKFYSLVDEDTVLVVTDYDLTSKGLKGLFGLTIVGWCQKRFIPVGDFSRANFGDLPKEPNLFELRVPPTDVEGARFIASAFHGFNAIRQVIANSSDLRSKRSLAAVLAYLLDRPHLESQFALYVSRLGSSNAALVQRISETAGPEIPNSSDIVQVLSYALGHILLNAVLKFPGPILSEKALCAYMSTSEAEAEALSKLFEGTSYQGPFGDSAPYFWREEIDEILDQYSTQLDGSNFESFGDYNRAATELALNRKLAAHDCSRCGGQKGGFLCPFTERTVCQRADCSVSASSWVPQGAELSRVERGFYDEWAPILGL